MPETIGSGGAFLDYDNDGWQDILLINSMDWPEQKAQILSSSLQNNKDGTFTDVTRQTGLAVEMYGIGVAVADYDNDGNADIYVTCVGPNYLFRNLGGKFADVTGRAGVGDPGFSTSAAWFDYDNDGRSTSLWVITLSGRHKQINFVRWMAKTNRIAHPRHIKVRARRYIAIEETVHLRMPLQQAGLNDPAGKTLGVALLDFDNDGWLDLFVANDTEPNKLYRNNHNGTFTDNAVIAGVAFSEAGTARAGMGVDAADYDGSGTTGYRDRKLHK